jgi:hypothetical protein
MHTLNLGARAVLWSMAEILAGPVAAPPWASTYIRYRPAPTPVVGLDLSILLAQGRLAAIDGAEYRTTWPFCYL